MNRKNELIERVRAGLGKKQLIAIAAVLALGVAGGAAILGSEAKKPAAEGEEHGHGHDEAAGHADNEHHGAKGSGDHSDAEGHQDTEHHESAKGPNGGQLLSQGGNAIEVLLTEEGGEPRMKVWLSKDGKPVAPVGAVVTAELKRPNGQVDAIPFEVQKDALVSKVGVAEPHVFSGTIDIKSSAGAQRYAFNQSEGVIAMNATQMKVAGVSLDTAGAATVSSTLQLPGEIRFNEDRTAHVVPRVAGVVEQAPVTLGQAVKQGQVLAVISSAAVSDQRSELQAAQKRLALARTTYDREKKLFEEKISPEQDVLQAEQAWREAEIAVANARQKLQAVGAGTGSGSLNRYELRAPFDGIVVEKHIALGEQVREDAQVFTISDLRTVWAQINVPAQALPQVQLGREVTIRSTSFDQQAKGKVAYVGSLIGEQTRTALARVVVVNPDMTWRPGLFVNVEVSAGESAAAVTVASNAVQTYEGKSVIFLHTPAGFVPQPVTVGRTDAKRAEIVQGLQAGSRYAATGAFVIKAEAGKSSASHEH